MSGFDLSIQDTLISQSKIWLFGRTMADIKIDAKVYEFLKKQKDDRRIDQPPILGHNNFLLDQLTGGNDPKFARVYGYSYESYYHDLDYPAIFLVHGDGIEADTPNRHFDPNLSLIARVPANVGRTGVGAVTGSFAQGMRAWAYDRADFTMRLDVSTGSFDALVLAAEAEAPEAYSQSAGSLARPAGSLARPAGSLARPAGSLARPGRRGRNGE